MESSTAAQETPIKPLDASLTFLGTASMRPSPTRNVSATALRIGREWTVVDCGEGTQHQILKCTSHPHCTRISPGNINRILITHLHGDHCFGLPGLLCLIDNACTSLESNRPAESAVQQQNNNNKVKRQRPASCGAAGGQNESDSNFNTSTSTKSSNAVQIVGPRGLRNMIRMALLSSSTGISFPFRVDELWTETNIADDGNNPNINAARSMKPRHFAAVFDVPGHPSELPGINVRPETTDGTWILPAHPSGGPVAEAWTLYAAPLVHTIETVGYVFREAPHMGTMDTSTLRDRLLTDENKEYQRTNGIRNPLQLLGMMQQGQIITIKESGALVELNPKNYMSSPMPGRKVVILGDTCDSRQIAGLAANADVIVHEATNAAIEDGETEEGVTKVAVSRGHSTPAMAGSFARACRARQLICTHFSSRYKGDESEESLAIMERIAGQARTAFGNENVVTSRDLMEVKLLVQRGRKSIDFSQSISTEEASKAASDAADFYFQTAGHYIKDWDQQLGACFK